MVSTRRLSRVALIAAVIFLLALVPRTTALGRFLTPDEPDKWFVRVHDFRQALELHDYAHTNLTGHPGVTTMWLGTVGLFAYDQLAALGWIDPYDRGIERLFLRLPLALVTALCIGLAYPLLRRLFGARVALLAALFWAADPFLVAHSRVLHLDALLASFMTLAVLAALVAFVRTTDRTQPDVRYLIASAVAGGLALLTKSPAVLLLPVIGLITLGGVVHMAYDAPQTGNLGTARAVTSGTSSWFGMMMFWCFIAALTWMLLWPAAWVDLLGALGSVINEVILNGSVPHIPGNFFLGRVDNQPGVLYYPVAVMLRLTPWVCLGLGGVLFALARLKPRFPSEAGRYLFFTAEDAEGVETSQMGCASPSALVRRTGQRHGVRPMVALGLFVIFFLLMMSISPKKFDRYVLAVFPALDIIAAWGWIWLLHLVSGRWRVSLFQQAGSFVWPLVVLGLAANLAWYHPYEMAYYNPLVGGSKAAVWAMYVGWGEGLDQAGAFISAQFNGCDRPVAAQAKFALVDFVCSNVLPMNAIDIPGRVDYAVLYVSHLQRNIDRTATAQLLDRPPLYTVRIHGIDYAYVYQIPQPVAHALDTSFGSSVSLRGYDLDASQVRASGVISVSVQWQAQTKMSENYQLFIHILNGAGEIVGQADVPPGGPRVPLSVLLPEQFVDWVHPVPVPADLPPGSYWVSLGLYDPQTFARLPLQGPTQPDAPGDGADALVLPPLVLP